MLINIEDLRRRARRRLPRAVFDFIDGGAEDESTLRRNHAAFNRLTFRPRVLVDTGRRDQSTTVLGQHLSTPLILAPTGLCGMAAPRGEVLAARAASRSANVTSAMEQRFRPASRCATRSRRFRRSPGALACCVLRASIP